MKNEIVTTEFTRIANADASLGEHLPQGEVETQQTSRLPAALVKASAGRHPAAASSFVARQATAAPGVAQSPVKAESPSLLHFFVATFRVKLANGKFVTQIIEVPHTSNKERDTKAAWKAVRAKYPELPKDNVRRTASRIVSRPASGNPPVEIYAGQTIRQLFPDKTEHETARVVGTVIFDGALCDVVLRHIRAKGAVSLTVRQNGGQSANFSQQHNTQQLATELPRIIAEELDGQGEDLKLFFVTKKP